MYKHKAPIPCGSPRINLFKPHGVTRRDMKLNVLSRNEFQAICLSDMQEVPVILAAAEMHLSKAAYTLLLHQARKRVADAIINGKGIKIEAGSGTNEAPRTFCCEKCRTLWTEQQTTICPICDLT